jgi:septum formation protein
LKKNPFSAIVLASSSPRRRELLASVGIEFTVVPSRISEEVLPGETPEKHVMRLSKEKAWEVAARIEVPGRLFIGSDTIVLNDDLILGKPKDAGDAAAMLHSLSGNSHRVLSGYAVFDKQTGSTVAGMVATLVRFKELTEEEITGYIATGEPFDKAGAYAIQGIGAFMIRSIEGSYTNVVGLPLCEVVEVLERLGAVQIFGTSSCRQAAKDKK